MHPQYQIGWANPSGNCQKSQCDQKCLPETPCASKRSVLRLCSKHQQLTEPCYYEHLLHRCRRSGFRSQHLHYFWNFSSPYQKVRHELHGMVNMFEEGFVTGTKIVQARFSIRSVNEPGAGTLAVAGKLYLALPAVARQSVLFVIPELPLLIRR